MKIKSDVVLDASFLQAAAQGDLSVLKRGVTIGNVNTIFSLSVQNAQTGEAVTYPVTLLYMAAQSGHTEMVRWLKNEMGADVNIAGISGNTPLMSAIANHKPETAAVLLEGTNINHKNPAGETAVSMACFYGSAAMVGALINQGADVNIAENNGLYPINYAAQLGKSDVLSLLVEGGADINTKEPGGTTPLVASIVKGQPHAAARLIELGANVNISNASGLYPSHYAALNGDLATLKLLITDYNVNQPALADHRSTPLYLAAQSGHAEVARWLRVEKDADVNLVGALGMTPLQTAILHHKPETASALIELGAKYNIPNVSGFFPIHAAAESGDISTIGLLCEVGCDVNLKALNPSQQTPMHVAFIKAQMEVINCLLDRGANINEKTTEEKTPLHLLLENDQILLEKKLELVKSYLDKFDCSIKDIAGKTVFDYAQEHCSDCVELVTTLAVRALVATPSEFGQSDLEGVVSELSYQGEPAEQTEEVPLGGVVHNEDSGSGADLLQ